VQNTGHRLQVIGYRSQVTENSIKLDTPLGFSCLFSFVSFSVTPQSGICLQPTMLFGFVLRVKQLNVESCTLCWILKSSFSGDLETRLFLRSTLTDSILKPFKFCECAWSKKCNYFIMTIRIIPLLNFVTTKTSMYAVTNQNRQFTIAAQSIVSEVDVC